MSSATLERLVDDFSAFWRGEAEPGASRIVLKAQSFGMDPEEMYSIPQAIDLLGKSTFFNDADTGLLVPDFTSGEKYGRFSYGWRFLLLEEKPDSRYHYLHVVRERDWKQIRVVENVFHTRPDVINQLIQEGELEMVGGKISGRSVIALYKRIMDSMTPERIGLSSFPVLPVERDEILDIVRERFQPQLKRYIKEISDSLELSLDTWYDVRHLMGKLNTWDFHLFPRMEELGIPRRDDYLPGIAAALFCAYPSFSKHSKYPGSFDNRTNIKGQACHFFGLTGREYNTLLEKDILQMDGSGFLTLESVRGLFREIVRGYTLEEMGARPYMGDFGDAPEGTVHRLDDVSTTHDNALDAIFPRFRRGVILYLPDIADALGVDLSKDGYTGKEINTLFGVSTSVIHRAEHEQGILKPVGEDVKWGKKYHPFSVALFLARDTSKRYPSIDRTSLVREELEALVAQDDECAFPRLSDQDVQAAISAGIFRRTHWEGHAYLERGCVVDFYNFMCTSLEPDSELTNLRNRKGIAPREKETDEDWTGSLLPVFRQNTLAAIVSLSSKHGIAYDRDYSVEEVSAIAGIDRSTAAKYASLGILKKRSYSEGYSKYAGATVVLLKDMLDATVSLPPSQVALALRIEDDHVASLLDKGVLKRVAEDNSVIVSRTIYDVYIGLMSRLDLKDIEEGLGIDMERKYASRREIWMQELQRRFDRACFETVKEYERAHDLATVITSEETIQRLGITPPMFSFYKTEGILATPTRKARAYEVSVIINSSRPDFKGGVPVEEAGRLFSVSMDELDSLVECDILRSPSDGVFRLNARLASLYNGLMAGFNKRLEAYIAKSG